MVRRCADSGRTVGEAVRTRIGARAAGVRTGVRAAARMRTGARVAAGTRSGVRAAVPRTAQAAVGTRTGVRVRCSCSEAVGWG